MKILIVSNGFPPSTYGGVEIYSLDLARELRRRGHEVMVFCREAARERQDYETWQDSFDDIPVVRVVNDFKRASKFRQLYADPLMDGIFARLLEDFRPDLVHYNHFLALSATLPQETTRRKIPAVIMLHDYWSICQRINLLNGDGAICPGPRQGADCYRCVFLTVPRQAGLIGLAKRILPYNARVILRRVLRRPNEARIVLPAAPADFPVREEVFRASLAQAARCIVPSQFVSDILVQNGVLDRPAQVIPLGIGFSPLPRQPRRAGSIRIGFAGSILPIKGLESLIRAFRAVNSPNLRLDIYGREDLHPVYVSQVHQLADEDRRITFHGSYAPDSRAEIFANIDLFVLPSIWHETFSFVAREALHAGVPVIAARVGALTEAIQEGVNGFLYPPGDVDALSAVLRRVVDDPGLLNSLQTPGPVDILTVPQHVDRMEAVYNEICGS